MELFFVFPISKSRPGMMPLMCLHCRVRIRPHASTHRLAEAVLQSDILLRSLAASIELHETGKSGLIDRLRSGIYHICAAVIGLGKFDKDAQIHDINVPMIAGILQQGCPGLCSLLRRMMEP